MTKCNVIVGFGFVMVEKPMNTLHAGIFADSWPRTIAAPRMPQAAPMHTSLG